MAIGGGGGKEKGWECGQVLGRYWGGSGGEEEDGLDDDGALGGMSRAKSFAGRELSAMCACSSPGALDTPCGNPSYALNAMAAEERIRPDGGGGVGRLRARPRPARRSGKPTIGIGATGTREPHRCAATCPSWDAATFAAGRARTPSFRLDQEE